MHIFQVYTRAHGVSIVDGWFSSFAVAWYNMFAVRVVSEGGRKLWEPGCGAHGGSTFGCRRFWQPPRDRESSRTRSGQTETVNCCLIPLRSRWRKTPSRRVPPRVPTDSYTLTLMAPGLIPAAEAVPDPLGPGPPRPPASRAVRSRAGRSTTRRAIVSAPRPAAGTNPSR